MQSGLAQSRSDKARAKSFLRWSYYWRATAFPPRKMKPVVRRIVHDPVHVHAARLGRERAILTALLVNSWTTREKSWAVLPAKPTPVPCAEYCPPNGSSSASTISARVTFASPDESRRASARLNVAKRPRKVSRAWDKVIDPDSVLAASPSTTANRFLVQCRSSRARSLSRAARISECSCSFRSLTKVHRKR